MVQTNTGKNTRRDLIANDITHVAVGTGTTAASATDTSLESEEKRKAVDDRIDGATGVITVRTRFLNGLEAELTEVGSLDGVAGDLQDRIVHAEVDKNAGVKLLVDITYTIS